jgi:opacity protein-like surface antigen
MNSAKNKNLFSIIAASAALTGSIMAGQPEVTYSKGGPPIQECFGIGWYGAIFGGVNVYQDTGGKREVTTRRGTEIELDPDDNIGGFGGLKLGYVFGDGIVRPAFEADIFYNGIDADVAVNVNGDERGSISGRVDSVAFMGNALLRFSCDKFQPYLGFGLGYWVAEANDGSVKVGDTERRSFSTNSEGYLAWQLIAGFDYYFNPKFSGFFEYKFLNYENAIFDNAIRQQLLGVGLRIHF